jgi:hypothetical protein
MDRTRPALLTVVCALALATCACCAGAPGTIAGSSADTSFVKSDARLWVRTPDGATLEIGLDGSAPTDVVGPKLYVLDLSDDAAILVLGNSDTDLFLKRGGETRQVDALRGRTGSSALSPDGRTLAVVRHADFDRPQSQWKDDDALYLVDVETGDVQIIPKSADVMVTNLAWSRDGSTIWLRQFEGAQAVSFPKGERSAQRVWPAPDTLRARPNHVRPLECDGASIEAAGWRFDEGIDLVRVGEPPRRIVKIDGRERGFHDYLPTITSPSFTQDCRHIVFVFQATVWVADVASGDLGPVHPGSEAFLRPR